MSDSEKEKLKNFFGSDIQKEDDIPNAGSVRENFRFVFYKENIPQNVEEIIDKVKLSNKRLEEEKLNDLYYHQEMEKV